MPNLFDRRAQKWPKKCQWRGGPWVRCLDRDLRVFSRKIVKKARAVCGERMRILGVGEFCPFFPPRRVFFLFFAKVFFSAAKITGKGGRFLSLSSFSKIPALRRCNFFLATNFVSKKVAFRDVDTTESGERCNLHKTRSCSGPQNLLILGTPRGRFGPNLGPPSATPKIPAQRRRKGPKRGPPDDPETCSYRH